MERTHLQDGALLALLDGEATAAERGAPEAHLAQCEECAGRLDTLRFAARRVAGALEALDAETPWTALPPELAEAMRARPTPITAARSRRLRVGRRSVATAAGLIFVLAAGAYAVPGSPVREFVARSAVAISSLFSGGPAPVDPGPSAVSVEPVDGFVAIRVLGAAPDLRIRIRTGTATIATVSAPVAGRFQVEAGVIEVQDAEGRLEIELPAGVDGTVAVDGRVIATQTGGALERAPGADDSPVEILVEPAG